jgi:hypothetical protein
LRRRPVSAINPPRSGSVRPLELVLNLFLLLSLQPVVAAAQVPSPLLALCRMPPVKGRSKLPYGPCANAACCFSIDIRCGCRCGHDDERDVVPEHHIFHPECCAAAADDPALLGDEVCRPCFPSAATLEEGRAFGVDMRASRRWYTVSEKLRDPRLGLQLLPEKAVLCPTCFKLFDDEYVAVAVILHAVVVGLSLRSTCRSSRQRSARWSGKALRSLSLGSSSDPS